MSPECKVYYELYKESWQKIFCLIDDLESEINDFNLVSTKATKQIQKEIEYNKKEVEIFERTARIINNTLVEYI